MAINKEELINPILFIDKEEFQYVDKWIPNPEDMMFRSIKDYIILDVSSFHGLDYSDNSLDMFCLIPKRAYKNPSMREHVTKYLNYLEKFYDIDHFLYSAYCKIKYMIDYETGYTKEMFFFDLIKYIIRGPVEYFTEKMVEDNYVLNLNYKSRTSSALQYSNKHGKLFMKISVQMNEVIPLLCHFMYKKKIKNSADFVFEMYDKIIDHPDIDIYSKLYETAYSNIIRSVKSNQPIWAKQDIRGIDPVTHAIQAVQNLLNNIICKYDFSKNFVHYNYSSILKNIKFQVTDIEYEYAFVSLSSSKRDEDMNSEFDKFESYMQKSDSQLLQQVQISAEEVMNFIRTAYGPFDPEEIKFFKHRLIGDDGIIKINSLQIMLILNLFYKYFQDPQIAKAINLDDYICLMIAARNILEDNGMYILAGIVSSKVIRLATRKSVNKKEMTKIENGELYSEIKEKYNNEKIIKYILSIAAALLSSDFEYIDYYDDEIDGKRITITSDIALEEVQMYVSMI